MGELFADTCRKKMFGILTGAGAAYLLYRAIRSGLDTPKEEEEEDILIDRYGNSTMDSLGAVGDHAGSISAKKSIRLNLHDLKTVLSVLHENKDPVIRGTILNSIYWIPGFLTSQELFLAEGGISIIAESLDDPLNYIKASAVTVFNYLSNDPLNRERLAKYIPQVLELTTSDLQEFEQLPCLRFLTAMSQSLQRQPHLQRTLPGLFHLLETGSSSIKFQVLQVLINLSANFELTCDLLKVRVPPSFLFLFNYFQRPDVLSDLLLFVSNLNETRRGTAYRSVRCEYCPDSVYVLLFGSDSQFSSRLVYLMAFPDDRIKIQAARIVTSLGCSFCIHRRAGK